MPLTNAEKQKRFYDRRVKTGGVKRYEFRLAGEDNMLIQYLADHWGCSLTTAFERCVKEAWEKEGKPVPGQTGKKKGKENSYTDNQPKGKDKTIPEKSKSRRKKN